MDTFRLVDELYSQDGTTFLIIGENLGRYEVRDGGDEPFTVYISIPFGDDKNAAYIQALQFAKSML